MVIISFKDRATEKKALGFLLGRFSGRIARNGEHIVPEAALVALSEQVRTRVLRFALELKDSLPKDSVDATDIPADTVEKSVVNNIFGGKPIDWT